MSSEKILTEARDVANAKGSLTNRERCEARTICATASVTAALILLGQQAWV